jgi:hypothetical protein
VISDQDQLVLRVPFALESFLFFCLTTEADQVSETLSFRKTNTIDNVHKNSHVYFNTPSTFRFSLSYISYASDVSLRRKAIFSAGL